MSFEMELDGCVSRTQTKYSYRAVIQNIINYNKIIGDTGLLPEGWKYDTATHFELPDPIGENTGVTARTAWSAISNVVPLFARPQIDLFH